MEKELKVGLGPGRTGKSLFRQSPVLRTFAAMAEEQEEDALYGQLQR